MELFGCLFIVRGEEMARPLGVSIIAVVFALNGIVVMARTVADLDAIVRPALVPALLLGNLLIPVAGICAAYGLWRRLSWGWRLAAALAISDVFLVLAQFAWAGSHSALSVFPMLWKVIIPLAIAGYLLRSSLIEAFGWTETEVKSRRAEALWVGLLIVIGGLVTAGIGIYGSEAL